MRCYRQQYSNLQAPYPEVPCGNGPGIHSCCAAGDHCGQHGFCFSPSRVSNLTSGYYLGGCTDPNLNAEACPYYVCYNYDDVVYDSKQQSWSCCERKAANGTWVRNCSLPVGPGFAAPPPTELFAQGNVSVSSIAPTTASTTTSPSHQIGPTELIASGSKSEKPDSVVMYVASIVPAVVLLAGLSVLLLCWRARKARKKMLVALPYGPQTNDMEAARSWTPEIGTLLHRGTELDSRSAIPEMSDRRSEAELDSRWLMPELAGRRKKAASAGQKSVASQKKVQA